MISSLYILFMFLCVLLACITDTPSMRHGKLTYPTRNGCMYTLRFHMSTSTYELSEQEKSMWCQDLNKEQTILFTHYLNGDNVFMTGAGGCGKTYLIRRMYQHGSQTGRHIQVCATTGCAAILLECHAKTIHSWAGIGLGNGDPDNYVSSIKTNRNKLRAWVSVQTLIIDELSMMSKKLFELLDYIGRKVRQRNVPFGGIQVIASGDFYQLPPVSRVKDTDESAFAFESNHWSDIFPIELELTNNHRQKDKAFLKALNEVRVGKITRSSYTLLQSYVGRTCDQPDIEPARLLPTRYKVNSINQAKLACLDEPTYTFEAEAKTNPFPYTDDTHKSKKKPPAPSTIKQEVDFMIKNGTFVQSLDLKQYAQVMCIINYDMDKGIVNGSIGKVLDILTTKDYTKKYHPEEEECETLDTREYPVVRFANGELVHMKPHTWLSERFGDFGIGVRQLPLILAWAVSIHKSQGMTVDMAEIDIGRSIFECGQSYVALSRVRSLEGLYLTAFEPSKIKVHRKVKTFYQSMKARQTPPTQEEKTEITEKPAYAPVGRTPTTIPLPPTFSKDYGYDTE